MFWGLGLQFSIGIFVIRTQPGFVAFNWLGEQVTVSHLLDVIRTSKCQPQFSSSANS